MWPGGRVSAERYPPDMDGSLRRLGSHPCRAERAGGQLIPLVQALGGEQHGRAAGGQHADDLMYLGPAGRVQAVRSARKYTSAGTIRLAARSRRWRIPPE